MKRQVQTLIKSLTASAKIFVRTFSRVITPPPQIIPTSCVNINALLMHLCDFDQFTYQYIIKWLAYPLQNPGARMQHGLMVNGPRGTGHSLFFEKVVAALHAEQGRCISVHEAFGKTHIAAPLGTKFLLVKGRIPAGFMERAYQVAGGKFGIIDRDAGAISTAHQMNVVFASYSEDFLPVGTYDRRYFAIEAPPTRDRLFYAAVEDEIKNGGADAFREYLLQGVNVTGFNQFSEPPSFRVHAPMEFA